MNKSDCIDFMKNWYGRRFVLYEMYWSVLANREFCVLIPKYLKRQGEKGDVRYLRILNPDGITYCLNNMINFEEQQRAFNFYYSIAKYEKGLPVFSHVLRWRNVDKKVDEWRENHWKSMCQYDCFIDIDSPDSDTMYLAKDDAKKIIEYLDGFKIPYYLRFSGMGYHIIIPYQAFLSVPHHFNPDENVENSIYSLFNEIILALNKKFSEFIDTNLHDSRRVTKVPYSLVFYDDGAFVSWPFSSKEEFLSKNRLDFRLNKDCHFKGEEKIYKRGHVLFNKESMLQSRPIIDLLTDLKLKDWVGKIGGEKNNS